MKVTVKLNPLAVLVLKRAALEALEMTADAVKTDIVTSQVVPKNIGELERSAFVDTTRLRAGETKIVFDTPYARRLYWHPEYNFRTDKNSKAQGKWMQSYIDGHNKTFASKAFKTFFRSSARRYVR